MIGHIDSILSIIRSFSRETQNDKKPVQRLVQEIIDYFWRLRHRIGLKQTGANRIKYSPESVIHGTPTATHLDQLLADLEQFLIGQRKCCRGRGREREFQEGTKHCTQRTDVVHTDRLRSLYKSSPVLGTSCSHGGGGGCGKRGGGSEGAIQTCKWCARHVFLAGKISECHTNRFPKSNRSFQFFVSVFIN